MIDYQKIYHTGVLVPDLSAAMEKYGKAVQVTWASVVQQDGFGLWTHERGQEHVKLSFTYSCEGPQHLELIQGPPGTVWDGIKNPGIHHVGLFSGDIGADVDACLKAGWKFVASSKSPDEGYGLFAYMQATDGMIFEFVTSEGKPLFERWWAGGDLF